MITPWAIMKRLRHGFKTDSLFRNAVYLISSTAIMSALGFGFWVFVAHLYSPADIGTASALIAITLLISNLSLLGLNAGLIRFLPESRDQSRDINAAIVAVGLSAIVAALIYLVVERLIGGKLTAFIGHPWSWPIFMVLMAAVALNSLTDSVFIANRQAEYHTIAYTSFGVVKLILPLLLIPLASMGIFLAYIGAVVVSLALSFYLMQRGCDYRLWSRPNWHLLSVSRKYAANNYTGVLLAGLPAQILPSFIIATLGSAEAAYFALSWTMANLLYVIPASITQSLLAEGSHDPHKQRANLRRASTILVLTVIPAVILSVLVAPFLLRIFGPRYAHGSTEIFQIMAASTIFIAINAVASTVLNLRQRSFGIVIAQAALVLVTLGAAALLLPFGLVGIGLAMLLGYIASNLIYAIIFLGDRTKRRYLKPRRFLTPLKYLATLVGIVALVAALSMPVSSLSDILQSTTKPTVDTSTASTADGYGFSTDLSGLSVSALNQRLDAMQATGATWVRFDLSWNTVQPNNASNYDWSSYDRIVTALKAHHLHGLAILDFTPAWARGSDCTNSKFCAPNDPRQFAAFDKAAAERYSHQGLNDWEIWNEPNIAFRYHPKTDPVGYTALLKDSYVALKQVSSSSFVILGGAAPSESDASNLTSVDFLTAVYAAGGKGYFDAVATHPYTYPNSPVDDLPLGAWAQMTTMHDIMASHGDGNKQIWISEFGAPTNGPNVTDNHVSEAQQATILNDAINLFRSYRWSGPFFWYDYQDAGSSTRTSENFYGLVRADGSRKPSYAVWVQDIAAKATN